MRCALDYPVVTQINNSFFYKLSYVFALMMVRKQSSGRIIRNFFESLLAWDILVAKDSFEANHLDDDGSIVSSIECFFRKLIVHFNAFSMPIPKTLWEEDFFNSYSQIHSRWWFWFCVSQLCSDVRKLQEKHIIYKMLTFGCSML